jgi:hypothetical protein
MIEITNIYNLVFFKSLHYVTKTVNICDKNDFGKQK